MSRADKSTADDHFSRRVRLLGLASILAILPLQWVDFASLLHPGDIGSSMELGAESMLRLANLYVRALLSILLAAAGTLLLVWPAAHRMNELGLIHQKRIRLLTISLTLLYIAVFTIMSVQKNSAYHTDTDAAVWFEIFYDFHNGQLAMNSTVYASSFSGISANFLGAHFTPVVYILYLPFFAFIPCPQAGLFLQTLYLASSVIPLYLLARLRWNDYLSPYMLVIVFLLYPTIQYTILYQIEPLRLCLPLLLWSIYFLHIDMRRAYFIALILTLMVREDVSLVLFVLGIYAAVVSGKRKIGLATMALSLVYFIVITHVVMPDLFGSEKTPAGMMEYGKYGRLPGEMALNILLHPAHAAGRLLDPFNLLNIVIYLIPFLFTPLLSLTSFIAFPNIFTTSIAGDYTYSAYISYHTIPAVAIFFTAAIEGLNWLQSRSPFSSDPVRLRVSMMSAMLAASLCLNFFLGPSPVSRQFWDEGYRVFNFRTHNFHYSEYLVTDHHRLAEKFISAIPDDAAVSAESFFLPHLYKKKAIMLFPTLTSSSRKADYVLIDKTNPRKWGSLAVPGSWLGLRNNPQQYYDWIEKKPDEWELVMQEDGYFLYRRKGT